VYSLKEFIQNVAGIQSEKVPSDDLFCNETNIELTFLTNQMQETLDSYSYTLVDQGWLNLVYNGQELTLQPGDLYIYSPGFQVTILSGSEDYHAFCLIANEQITLETPVIWNIIRTAYYPISELGQPVIHLNKAQAEKLRRRMQEIIEYQTSNHYFLKESLRTLYTLFVLDLRDIMVLTIGETQSSERTTELFIGFIHLLPRHFIEHHDIDFYANHLHITSTHLSRIVRQVSGRTVIDYINQMLLMEASWLLQTTELSLAAISERLNFADQSSFGKFFTRMKGISPKAYRAKKSLIK